MSTTTLLDMRSAIVEVLKRELKSCVKEVREHGGRFTIEELKAYGASAPCVAVACMGVPDAADYGTDVRSRALWVAMVVAKDEGATKRDTIVLGVVHQLLMLISRQKWTTDVPGGTKTHGAKNAARVQAANLYSRQADAEGIALWAVTWEQDAFLEPLTDDVLVDFNTFIARYDVAPRDGVFDPTNEDEDTIEMEQP